MGMSRDLLCHKFLIRDLTLYVINGGPKCSKRNGLLQVLRPSETPVVCTATRMRSRNSLLQSKCQLDLSGRGGALVCGWMSVGLRACVVPCVDPLLCVSGG